MGLFYENLDDRVRAFMLNEIDWDLAQNCLYISERLNEHGRQSYTQLLQEAVTQHDDDWLANELYQRNCMVSHRPRTGRTGKVTMTQVPADAPLTLAEGEFNRFYIRGVCQCAIEDGISEVEVYRGKEVNQPRFESQLLIGKRFSARGLLEDLRQSPGINTALRLPPGPNSGLTARLP